MGKQYYLKYIKQLESYNLDILASWNCSIRINKKEIIIKPSGLSYNQLNMGNVCHIDFQWNKIDTNSLIPSSDRKQHTIIYHNNPTVNAIIHTHSHYATILANLGVNIEVICTMHADYFWKHIPCLPFVNHRLWNFWEWIYYKDSKVFLLWNHGTIALWKDLQECVKNTIILEEIAKLYYHSLLLNKNLSNYKLDQKDIDIMYNYYNDQYGQ